MSEPCDPVTCHLVTKVDELLAREKQNEELLGEIRLLKSGFRLLYRIIATLGLGIPTGAVVWNWFKEHWK